MGYKRHSICSCKNGVISPTRKLNAQFVAVEMETPFARTARGMISGGLNGILSRFYTIINGRNLQEPRDRPPTDINVRTN